MHLDVFVARPRPDVADIIGPAVSERDFMGDLHLLPGLGVDRPLRLVFFLTTTDKKHLQKKKNVFIKLPTFIKFLKKIAKFFFFFF